MKYSKEELVKLIVESEELAYRSASADFEFELSKIKDISGNDRKFQKELITELIREQKRKYRSKENVYKSAYDKYSHIHKATNIKLTKEGRIDFIAECLIADMEGSFNSPEKDHYFKQTENLRNVILNTYPLRIIAEIAKKYLGGEFVDFTLKEESFDLKALYDWCNDEQFIDESVAWEDFNNVFTKSRANHQSKIVFKTRKNRACVLLGWLGQYFHNFGYANLERSGLFIDNKGRPIKNIRKAINSTKEYIKDDIRNRLSDIIKKK